MAILGGVESLQIHAPPRVRAEQWAHLRTQRIAGVRVDDDRHLAVRELDDRSGRIDAERAHEEAHRRSAEVAILQRDRAAQRLVRLVAQAVHERALSIEEARDRDHPHHVVRDALRLEGGIPAAVDAPVMLERARDPQRRSARREQRARSDDGMIAKARLVGIGDERLGYAADPLREEDLPDVVEHRRRRGFDADVVGVARFDRHRPGHQRNVRCVRRLVSLTRSVRARLERERARVASRDETTRHGAHAHAIDQLLRGDRARGLVQNVADLHDEILGACPLPVRLRARLQLGEPKEHVRETRLRFRAELRRIRDRREVQRASEERALGRCDPALKDDALELVARHRVGERGEARAELGEWALAHDELAVQEREDDFGHAIEKPQEARSRRRVGACDGRMAFGVVRANAHHVREAVQRLADVGPLGSARCARLGH